MGHMDRSGRNSGRELILLPIATKQWNISGGELAEGMLLKNLNWYRSPKDMEGDMGCTATGLNVADW